MSDDSRPDEPGTAVPRAQVEQWLTEAEQGFKSEDPYERAAAYDYAARCYGLLGQNFVKDVTDRHAYRLAAEYYKFMAARVRWAHQIPTIYPQTMAGRLVIGRCEECGRPWQYETDTACAACPRLLHGPTPDSAADAERYRGASREVELSARQLYALGAPVPLGPRPYDGPGDE